MNNNNNNGAFIRIKYYYYYDAELVCVVASQLEVPALFIQWEALTKLHDGQITLAQGSCTALKLWAQTNPLGRVLVIHDGSYVPGGA